MAGKLFDASRIQMKVTETVIQILKQLPEITGQARVQAAQTGKRSEI